VQTLQRGRHRIGSDSEEVKRSGDLEFEKAGVFFDCPERDVYARSRSLSKHHCRQAS